MTTIVVPLDGSLDALVAVRPAVAFAARSGHTDVLLLSWVDSGAGRAHESRVRDDLEEQAERFRGVIEVNTEVRSGGTAVEGILETLASRPDATLCLASRGRGGIRKSVLGSVAAAVIGSSTHPMIVVGPTCGSVLLPGERGDMMVCTDGSAFAAAIMPVATKWANDLGLTPWLVEVVPPDENVALDDEAPRNREVEAGNARLSRLASDFEGCGLPARTSVLHGDPAKSITSFAARRCAAMVALSTHGRTGIARVRLGSVATEIVRWSPCPVLLLRPTG